MFVLKVLQSKHDALLERIDELDQECEELREKVMDIEGERDEMKDILDETKIQTENLTKTLAEKQVKKLQLDFKLSLTIFALCNRFWYIYVVVFLGPGGHHQCRAEYFIRSNSKFTN